MLSDELRKTKVKDLITTKTAVYWGANIKEAVNKMIENKSGVVAVLEEGTDKFLGLFTKRHLLRRVILQNREVSEPVHSVFTPNPVFVLENASAEQAFVLMYKYNYKYLPVVGSKNQFFGFIIAEDFLRLIEELYPETLTTATNEKTFTERTGA